jgi:hypothetical protein
MIQLFTSIVEIPIGEFENFMHLCKQHGVKSIDVADLGETHIIKFTHFTTQLSNIITLCYGRWEPYDDFDFGAFASYEYSVD